VLLALILAMTFSLVLPCAALTNGVAFPDVPSGAWYEGYIQKCTQFEIINGYPDGKFRPDSNLKRSEFIKMLAIAGELITLNNSTSVHWSQPYWNMLDEAGCLEGVNIPCTYESLEVPITRYEMAVLVSNVIYNVYGENIMEVESPETNITDYADIWTAYRGPVEQAYGKGILTGYSDGTFHGNWNLTRAEASAVIVRVLWAGERKKASFATEKKPTVVASDSFAFQYRGMDTATRHISLFGDPNKSYFTSAADAAGHMVTVQVQTWDLKSDGFTKYTRTWPLTVNVVVAEEVKAIFEEIYNNPEKFPIHALGGARYSDTLRHSWGCAIDINPVENYYINYSTGATVGSFCYQNGSSPYCITPNGSVVQAFAKYGWGWGGQGWSTAADYMHFSILASGG
jgi:hypothetical protein